MAKITNTSGKPHSGQVSVAVVGLVDDNVDPDELGRIRVRFPTLHQEPVSFWIRIASPMAGEERGFYALPEIDDEVLVIFLQGSQDVGVVVGQFWNGVDLPPREASNAMPGSGATDTGASWSTDTFADGSTDIQSNDRRFWKSRSGHLLVFDDTSGSETVQIWDGSHTLAFVFDTASSRIVLSNTSGDIHIRTAQDLYLEAGNDIKWRAGNNIEGESASDTNHKVLGSYSLDVTSSATLKSGQDFTAQSTGGNLTCKSAMTTTCSGGVSFKGSGDMSTSISGGSMTEIKGGMVKIN